MAEPVEYERKTKALTEHDVRSAISYSQSNAIAGKVSEWRDEKGDKKSLGLVLRITPGLAVWYLRRRNMTLRLGPASDISLDAARYFAEQVKLAAKRKRDLREFVNTLVALELDKARFPDRRSQLEWADALADETSALAYRKRFGNPEETWTWKALTRKFLDYKLPKLKGTYRKHYENYLTLKEFDGINDKLVNEVKLRDLERLRENILLNHASSAVHRAVTQSKAMLSWAFRYHAAASGLDAIDVEWWNRWSFEYSTGKRTRTPAIEEIARTIVLAENFRSLADGEHATYAGTIGALWGVALTGQRTGAFVKTRTDRMFEPSKSDKLPGWKIFNWTTEEMKGGKDGGRPHSLPLPPEALKILFKWHAESGSKSKWLFTAKDPDKHITQSALRLLMYRLQGRVYDHTVKQKAARKGKPGPKPKPKKVRPDVFALYDIEPWTLHDCRRTLATYLDDKRLGGAATAILGHKTDHDRVDEREKMAPITKLHYNRSQRIGLKADGMKVWVKALLAAYAKESRKFRDLLSERRAAA
jgi:integrase